MKFIDSDLFSIFFLLCVTVFANDPADHSKITFTQTSLQTRLRELSVAVSRLSDDRLDYYLRKLEDKSITTLEAFEKAYLKDYLYFDPDALSKLDEYQNKVQDFLRKVKPLLETAWKHIVELNKKGFPASHLMDPEYAEKRLRELSVASSQYDDAILSYYLGKLKEETITTLQAFEKSYLKDRLYFDPDALEKIDEYQEKVQKFLKDIQTLLQKAWKHIVELNK